MSADDLAKLSIANTADVSEAQKITDDVAEASESLKTTDTTEISEPLKISDVKAVTSYNWLNTAPPTVKVIPKLAVPGSPARWVGREDTRELKPDKVARWVNQNKGRCADSPLEPGIRAIMHQIPHYDFTSLDVITDTKELVQLLELACGKKEAFEFGAQVIGNTVLFVPTEKPRLLTPNNFMGFKKSFDHEYMQYDAGLEGSQQHFRIITYQIGEVKIMLRYSADGYLPALAGEVDGEVGERSGKAATKQRAGNIIIESKGRLVPHESVIELNTRLKHGECDNTEALFKIKQNLREAWLSQSHRYVLALYTPNKASKDRHVISGTFKPSDIIFKNYEEIVEESGMGDEKTVRAFYEIVEKVLKDLRAAAVEGKGGMFLVKYEGGDADVVVEPCKIVKGLSGEILERVKCASV